MEPSTTQRTSPAASRAAPAEAEAQQRRTRIRPPELTDAVTLEWVDLHKTRGSDGADHLYYLVTGGPEGTPAQFRLRVDNPQREALREIHLKVRLSSQEPDGTYRTVPLEDQGSEDFKSWRSRVSSIAGQGSHTFTFAIRRETLEAAYNAAQPRCRLEAEVHWRQPGRRYYYNRRALAFFLMQPVEYLIDTTAKSIATLSTDATAYRDLWQGLAEIRFDTSNQVTYQLQSSLTLSEVDAASMAIQGAARPPRNDRARRRFRSVSRRCCK